MKSSLQTGSLFPYKPARQSCHGRPRWAPAVGRARSCQAPSARRWPSSFGGATAVTAGQRPRGHLRTRQRALHTRLTRSAPHTHLAMNSTSRW